MLISLGDGAAVLSTTTKFRHTNFNLPEFCIFRFIIQFTGAYAHYSLIIIIFIIIHINLNQNNR